MTYKPNRITQLEQKLTSLEASYLLQVRYLGQRICELQEEIDRLSGVPTDLEAIEKLVFNAHTASGGRVQDALAEIDRIVPLDNPWAYICPRTCPGEGQVFHFIGALRAPSTCDRTSTRPPSVESAPYLPALVASSCSARPIACAAAAFSHSFGPPAAIRAPQGR
jgi:hypothetical protein